jgi:RNA polymerase sigma-70 factor (ECF subfamily)
MTRAGAKGQGVGVHPAEVGDVHLCALMVAYQAGDGAAFEALYEALWRPIGGYLRALSRDVGRAEDLLQETFLQVHRARHTYLPSRPVKPWVYAIARNVFLMSRRAATRRGRHEETAPEELPELPVAPEVDALGDRDAVRRALAAVPEDRREALLLHHVWGLSFREVAAVQGISEAAAKLRAHRGVVALRELLGGGGRS